MASMGRMIKKKEKDVVVPETTISKDDLLKKIQARRNYNMSLAERVAGDTYFFKNYYYPGSKDAFKFETHLQTVDKYFPYADGGPLFVDEAMDEETYELYEPKIEYMKANKFRYLLIKKAMNELDCVEALI